MSALHWSSATYTILAFIGIVLLMGAGLLATAVIMVRDAAPDPYRDPFGDA